MSKTKVYMGLLPSTPDPRDYTIQLCGTVQYPTKFKVADDPAAYDQGEIGSCVIQAIRSAPHAATGIEMGTSFPYGYWRSHEMQGLYMHEALEGFARDGIPPRSVDNVDYEVTKVIDYANANKDKMLAASEPYKGWTYVKLSTINEIKAIVYGSRTKKGQRCVVGLPYYSISNSYWQIDTGADNGTHAMAIVGWDDDEQAVILRNSWGEDGGMFGNGTCYLYCKYTDILDRAHSIYGLIPPATTPTDDNKEEEKAQDDVQVVRTLRLTSPYMNGDDVKHAQERLNVHGAKLTVDGIFGKNTYIATREFQAAQGLTIDGIIGKNTLAALDADPKVEPVQPVVDEELRKDFISYLYKQIGNIYCWGGNGEDASESAINSMENSSANKTRAKNFLAKQKKAGVQNIKMYDCSGLISRWLQDHGLAKKKRNCDHLWSMCTAVQKTELEACDLLFRGTDGDKTHVGVYVGNGMVIESRGRDYGVVIRPIDETAGYWQYFGRLNVI